MTTDSIYRKFKDTGTELSLRGLIATKSGNMSIRAGKNMIITTHGSKSGRLKKSDLIKLDLNTSKTGTKASMDSRIHLEIYKRTSWNAVVHMHPVYTTLLSLDKNEIRPIDVEGKYYFPKVKVVPWDRGTSKRISEALRKSRIAVARAHGTYAAAESLDDAAFWTLSLEHSCKLLFLKALMDKKQGLENPKKDICE